MKKRILIMLLMFCLSITSFTGCSADQDVTAEFIGQKLELLSELVTAKMTYHGVVEYTDGSIPFLTQKECLLVYHAEVKASIDLSKLEIQVSEDEVIIHFPQEVNTEVHVLSDSLKFYDSKTAVFNPETKEDAVAALKLAEDHILENGGIEQLEEAAIEEAVLLIQNFVQEIIGEKTLTIIR